MAYKYSTTPPGYNSDELLEDLNYAEEDDIPYDYSRDDATSPSGKYLYPYTTKEQSANEPSCRGHTRQASYSSVVSLNPDSIGPKFQEADLSPEVAPDERYEKDLEVPNNPFAFSLGLLNKSLSPKSMASYRESSAEAYSTKEPSPSIFDQTYASDSPYPFLRSYKLDSTMSEVYQDELYKPSMQNVAKPSSPKDALLEDLDALLEDLNDAGEHDMTYLFTKSETPGVSAIYPRNVLYKDKNDNQTEKVEPLATKNHSSNPMEALPEMLLQPDTRPISHEQLVVEVKGIYAGLSMVEAKCIDIDERQSAAAQDKDPSKKTDLKNDQWQALLALHQQLLHEHHDFFLSTIYQDKPYNPPMQNIPKTISPKDALLDFDDAEEDGTTSLFPQDTGGEEPMTSGVGRLSRKVSPGLPRPTTFKRQEGEKRERLTPVQSTSRFGSLLKAKQGLAGFANGSSIAAMADTGSRKNVISASYAKKLDLSIKGLPSTFAIGNSRKIQSLGKYTHIYLSFLNKAFPVTWHSS